MIDMPALTGRRKISMSEKIYKTGMTPGSGTYDCTNCHTKVHLGSGDTMPPCPKCTNNEFTKE